MRVIALLSLSLFLVCVCVGQDIGSVIQKLNKRITEAQVQQSQEYIPPFAQWRKLRGIYPSYVHLNFYGAEEYSLARRYIEFYDNNMFVTNWVSQALLEVSKYGKINISQAQLLTSVEALGNFKDKNNKQDAPTYSFWPQVLSNGTWKAFPSNIGEPLEELETFGKVVEELLKSIGLSSLIPYVSPIVEEAEFNLNIFNIPPDADDTSVNFQLGGLLKEQEKLFPKSLQTWMNNNKNMKLTTDALVKFSYKPFSTTLDDNLIDPRTYYWIRDFLAEEQEKNGLPSLFIVTTWLQNLAERRKGNYEVSMPFEVNNVDLTVASNTIFGLGNAALNNVGDVSEWFHSDAQKLYSDTSKLLAWAINHRIVDKRPDIALLYYPPKYDFLWFTSRTVYLLNKQEELPYECFKTAKKLLTEAMRGNGTNAIVENSVVDSKNSGWVYWDDFLGNDDIDIFGYPINHGDDRLFTTAVAVNALVDIWTQPDASCTRNWIPSTPAKIKILVEKAVSFLSHYILGDEYEHQNAFFSASVKGLTCDPFRYPGNAARYVNGTVLTNPKPQDITSLLIYGVSGFMPQAEYEKELTKLHFEHKTPLKFPGYNTASFPYWSSPTFTDAMAMLALTKQESLQACKN